MPRPPYRALKTICAQGGADPNAEFGGKTLLFRLCACNALPEAELLPQLALLLRAGASAATRFDCNEGRLMSPVLEVSVNGGCQCYLITPLIKATPIQ